MCLFGEVEACSVPVFVSCSGPEQSLGSRARAHCSLNPIHSSGLEPERIAAYLNPSALQPT
jgi:hypothetical protein